MITITIWKNFIRWCPEMIDYLAALLFSFFTIPLDIALLPVEIVAFILWKMGVKLK